MLVVILANALLVLSHWEGIFWLSGERGGLPWPLTVRRSPDNLKGHLMFLAGLSFALWQNRPSWHPSVAKLRAEEC